MAVRDAQEGGLEQLSYDLALRTLAQQERVLEELRARTGVLLTATAVVASFLGGRALQTSGAPGSRFQVQSPRSRASC